MVRFLAICLGGAFGTGVRYLVTLAAARANTEFPLGTWIVNVVGCLLLGVITHLAMKDVLTADQRLIFGTGVMGGLTTYSTFNIETIRLIEEGAFGTASLNFGLTVVTCFAAGFAGLALARWWTGP